MVTKKEIVRLLETIAIYMEIKGENSFKVSAYRKAANALELDDRCIAEISDFTTIPSIGKGTAAVILEFVESGKSTTLMELQDEVPKGLIPLLQIQGLGGKKIAKLYKQLHIENVMDLKMACLEGKVQALSGFGKKTEEKILANISALGNRPNRFPLAIVLPIVKQIEQYLTNIREILKFSRAGSLRRMKETVKDLDFIIATKNPVKVKEELIQIPNIKAVTAAGDTKVSIVIEEKLEISCDFRLVSQAEYATALHHFTGSKEHNVKMRQLAKERGEKISEYGVEVIETNQLRLFETEKAFFEHFGLPFIPPELREDGSEIEKFTHGTPLIKMKQIKGDLHMHSTWSDGEHSIENMVEACRKKGYQYMAITDHSQYLKVANGLTPVKLRKQIEEIRRLNEKYDDILILSGIEMDILPDGTLDFEDEILAELDIVIASIHSGFTQPRKKIMERLRNALLNRHVDIIAHPTGRLIGRREGYDVDVEMLMELAKETHTALELNANPNRLDLSSNFLERAQDKGIKIAINTDAHHINALDFMTIGVSTAMKGWVRPDTVLNTFDKKDLLSYLYRHH